MAKLQMERVHIFVPCTERKRLLSTLQKMAVLDVSAAESTAPEGFFRQRQDIEESKRRSTEAENALRVLGRFAPEKKGLFASFSGRRRVTAEEFFGAEQKADTVLEICETIIKAERSIAEKKAEILRLKTTAEQLSPWLDLDLPLNFSGTEKTVAFIGSVMGTLNLEELLIKLAEVGDVEPYVEIIGHTAGQTLIFATVDLGLDKELGEQLRMLGFSRPAVSSEVAPADKILSIKNTINNLVCEINKATEKIASYASARQDIELVCDWYISETERLGAMENVDSTDHTLHITGYVPSCDMELLKQKLESEFTIYIESEKVEGDDVPVKLQNGGFSSPAESITSMYALPSAADIDPTPITSFFYYLFFGIMLSDAGYGILMWIATWAVNKFLSPEENMRRNMKLFMYCGISTTLWGFFFGSFFGVDIITSVYTAITGNGLPFKYPFINPLNGDALAMLILSVGLGLLQIITGLVVKFYITCKQDGVVDAICDVGFWITTLLGFTVMALGLITLPVLKTAGLIMAAASMLGIVITGGRKKKGAMKFVGGLASLYDITGYVSDLLSFSRLMALGLTTAAMSMVFNLLGVMVSAGIIGKIFMVAILLVGHAVNFGLNALGAYVHTLRLQYVELFSKFYDGGGRAFMPFAFKGKYIRIKEDK